MKWAIPQLRKLAKPFSFEYDFDLFNELQVKDDIKEVKKCHVDGVCYEVSYDEYLFDLNIDLELVMVCSVSLLDVLVPLKFSTQIRFSYSIDDSSDDYLITKDTINLDEALLSEIVLNLPLKGRNSPEWLHHSYIIYYHNATDHIHFLWKWSYLPLLMWL